MSYRQRRWEQQRREAQRLRQDLMRALGASFLLHWGVLILGDQDLFSPPDPSPQWIEFQLISPPEQTVQSPPNPDLSSLADAQASGASNPDRAISAGGAAHGSPAAPSDISAPQTAPTQARVQSVAVASLYRRPIPDPVPVDPLQDLQDQLDQAVQEQQWQEAMALIDRMALALPQRSGQFSAYRDQLQQLVDRDAPSPIPTAPSTVAPAQPLVPAPASDPTQVFPAQPLPAQELTLERSPQEIPSETGVDRGSGGTRQGIANAQTPSQAETQLATVADPAWAEYLARLQERVQQHWSVRQAQGSYSTVVVFTLDKQGHLQQIQLQNPSQDPLVDAAVLSAIRQAAPFDPLPSGFGGDHFTFELDVLSGSHDLVLR